MSTKSQVLTLLMEQAPNALSGEEMGQQLSISRTAVWKAVNELKKEGHLISSSRTKGYRYESSDILSAEGIQLLLDAQTPKLTITVVDSSESTMKDARLAAINGQPTNTLIVADMQEAPKGRFGRPFFAKAGSGIYMSMLLRPKQNLESIAQYTLIMAVAIAKAMDELAHVHTEIKWVNDIYLHQKKVCGILSEAMSDVESGQINHVVIGMGINFSLPESEFPGELHEKATSLFPTGSPTITRNELIAAIWNHFYYLLNQTSTQSFLTTYREKSFVLGKIVQFSQAGQAYEGRATAINERGELVVQLPDQSEKVLSSGEISLRSIQ